MKKDENVYLYVFQYKDHLGNVRLSYADINNNGSIEPASEILEENNYYPFGLKHQGYNELANVNRSEQAEKYQYNGKEWNDALGLNIYEMDLRQYDPAIGRWTVQDPVVHHNFSPYSAFDNNPVYWADPSGADAVPITVMDLFNATENGSNASFEFSNGRMISANMAGELASFISEQLQAMYEMQPLEGNDNEVNKGNGGGNGNGGGDSSQNPLSTRTKFKNYVDITDKVLKSAEAISALDEFFSTVTKSGSKEYYKLMGKIGGKLSNVSSIMLSGLEYYNGEISGMELTFDLGTTATSIWISSQVGLTYGGAWGFVAGVTVGVLSEFVIKPMYNNYIHPQIVVPAQKSYNAWWTGYYNQIIFNISNYY